MPSLRLAGLLPLILTAHAATLFEDTFDRPDSRNIDASTDSTGTGSASAPLVPGNTRHFYRLQDTP